MWSDVCLQDFGCLIVDHPILVLVLLPSPIIIKSAWVHCSCHPSSRSWRVFPRFGGGSVVSWVAPFAPAQLVHHGCPHVPSQKWSFEIALQMIEIAGCLIFRFSPFMYVYIHACFWWHEYMQAACQRILRISRHIWFTFASTGVMFLFGNLGLWASTGMDVPLSTGFLYDFPFCVPFCCSWFCPSHRHHILHVEASKMIKIVNSWVKKASHV